MGQSINGVDRILAPFVRDTYNKYLKSYLEEDIDEKTAVKLAEKRTKKEVADGVQTIQYQINTLMTVNGR